MAQLVLICLVSFGHQPGCNRGYSRRTQYSGYDEVDANWFAWAVRGAYSYLLIIVRKIGYSLRGAAWISLLPLLQSHIS